jgi:branched-chain amino acid transport system substrate-binding protein
MSVTKLILSGETIRLGIGAPLSGPSALLGTEMRQAVELAIEEANASGGILGATISVFVQDDASDLEQGQSAARTFCAERNLLGVVGHYSSDVSIAASEIYLKCDLPMITPIASNPELTDRRLPNVFRFTNRDDRTARSISEYLYWNLGKRRAVIVESRSAYGKSMAHWFAKAFAELGGEIVERHEVDVGKRNFQSLIAALPKEFELLFYGGTFEGASILKAMREAGLMQRFAAGDGCWDVKNFVEPAGDALSRGEGVLVLSATPAIGYVRGSSDFAERYQNRYGPIINYAVNSYDCARALIRGLEAATRAADRLPERAEVVNSIRTLKVDGIAYPQPIEWDSKGDNTAAVTALYEVAADGFHQVAVCDESVHT